LSAVTPFGTQWSGPTVLVERGQYRRTRRRQAESGLLVGVYRSHPLIDDKVVIEMTCKCANLGSWTNGCPSMRSGGTAIPLLCPAVFSVSGQTILTHCARVHPWCGVHRRTKNALPCCDLLAFANTSLAFSVSVFSLPCCFSPLRRMVICIWCVIRHVLLCVVVGLPCLSLSCGVVLVWRQPFIGVALVQILHGVWGKGSCFEAGLDLDSLVLDRNASTPLPFHSCRVLFIASLRVLFPVCPVTSTSHASDVGKPSTANEWFTACRFT
jgi:hypothetical protein